MSPADERSTAQAAHHHLALEYVDQVREWGSFDEDTVAEAVRRLNERTDAGDWDGDRYRRPTTERFRDKPRELGVPPQLPCDLPELAVVLLLARTAPYNQFSVTPDGDIFAGDQRGYHAEIHRF